MIFDTYSKRQKAAKGDGQEVYLYDEIPPPLRIQIIYLWYGSLGNKENYYDATGESVRKAYQYIVKILRQEMGVLILPPSVEDPSITFLDELVDYFLNEKDVEKVLDVIEVSFKFIDNFVRKFHYQLKNDASEAVDQALINLNTRFKEHGVGYKFEGQQIIRIDSEFIHTKVVKPTLKLLLKPEYAGAQDEFLNACEHLRHGRKKEAVNDCLKSLESLMKSICDKRRWTYSPGATASTLIKICLENELIPSCFQCKLESLQNLLASGTPTIRNKMSGHGQGSEVIDMPDYLVSFVLNETASILFLLDQAEAALK
jgi:hypothetical protein